jgi:hypothetical protein
MLDMGFVWTDLFKFGLMVATVVCFLICGIILIGHLITTLLLVTFRKKIIWFLIPLFIASLILMVTYTYSKSIPALSEVWWGSSSLNYSRSESLDKARQMSEYALRTGRTTTIALAVITVLAGALSMYLRTRSKSKIALDTKKSSLETEPVVPDVAESISQVETKQELTAGKCLLRLGVWWGVLILMAVVEGLLLAWIGKNSNLYQIAFFIIPGQILMTMVVIFVFFCIWTMRLFGKILTSKAVGIVFCIIQIIIAYPITFLCFVAGYAAGGGKF